MGRVCRTGSAALCRLSQSAGDALGSVCSRATVYRLFEADGGSSIRWIKLLSAKSSN